MNYLNIHTDFLRSVDYLGADPIERATWLNLAAWCASQENGGLISGAADWPDRKWQQICGVTKEEATLVSDLYHLNDAGEMVVNHYPAEKEAEVKAKRETARANGKKGGRPPKQNPEKPTLDIFAKAEGKGREGKGKEIEEKEKGTREETGAVSPPPETGRDSLSLPDSRLSDSPAMDSIKNHLRQAFPASLAHFSKLETEKLTENLEALQNLNEIDWDILRLWVNVADDKARGCRLWPSNRSQFLHHAGEAMEKVNQWWLRSGSNWWAVRRSREKRKAERQAQSEPPADPAESLTPEEALAFLKN